MISLWNILSSWQDDDNMMQVYKKGGTNQNKNMEMTYEQIQKELGLGVQIE